MTSIRWWGHNADVMTAARAMDRLFDQFLGPGQGSTQEDGTPTYTAELGEAIHIFLARSRARLMLVQLEDVAGESEQANLPGTTEDHPNWQRRLSLRLEDILAGLELRHLAISVNAARRQARPETNRE